MLCGSRTKKGTCCTLPANKCRYHHTQPIVAPNDPPFTKEEEDTIDEFFCDKEFAGESSGAVWYWDNVASRYYTHMYTNDSCNDINNCYKNYRDCIFHCMCSACSSYMVDCGVAFKRNESNQHCVYCQCIDCVCLLRKQNKLHEPYAETPHYDNLCWNSCYICSKYR